MGRSHISTQIRRLGPEMPTSLCLILYKRKTKKQSQMVKSCDCLWRNLCVGGKKIFGRRQMAQRPRQVWTCAKCQKKKRININAILPFIENSNRKLALVVFPEEIMFWAFKPSQVSLMWPCLGCFDKCFANSHVCWCLGGTKLLFALIGGNQQSG